MKIKGELLVKSSGQNVNASKSQEQPPTDVNSSCKSIKRKSNVLVSASTNYISLFFFSIKLSGVFP